MFKQNEFTLKIKLPEEITVHYPHFDAITLDDLREANIIEEGLKEIERLVKDKAVDRFVEENEEFVEEMVDRFLDEKKEEWKHELKNK